MEPKDYAAQEMLAQVERKADLKIALSHLNPLQIAILYLICELGFTFKDTSRICGLNTLQAQTAYEDALRILRRWL